MKGNLLRVIETATAEKALLKGHKNAVADVCFSIPSPDLLCSVDSSGDGDGVFVWRLTSEEGTLGSQIVARFGISGCLVQPHPTNSSIWCVSDGRQLALIDADRPPAFVGAYSDFHLHHTFADAVQGGEIMSYVLKMILTLATSNCALSLLLCLRCVHVCSLQVCLSVRLEGSWP